MSRAKILVAGSDGQLQYGREFQNSHGFCSFIWDALIRKYADHVERMPLPSDSLARLTPKPYQLWNLVAQGSIEKYGANCGQRIPFYMRSWELNVLHMSYDLAFCRGREDLERFAVSLRVFEESLAFDPRYVCHLSEIADAVEKGVSEGVEYVAFHGTSVAENLWQVENPLSEEEEISDFSLYNFVSGVPDGARVSQKFRPRRWVMLDPTAKLIWFDSKEGNVP